MSTPPRAVGRRCPRCDSELRWNARRILATEIAFWAAVALIFASLWSSSEVREPYVLTAALALGAWWLLRAGPRRYCERCRLACD